MKEDYEDGEPIKIIVTKSVGLSKKLIKYGPAKLLEIIRNIF